ncbi:Protein sel-1 1 [Tetrabaena socialis]|uniref:Protein sel-1 1 n=1 Tax=Tetrabaena socialis TaxID=47790 RepID=A0A2J8AIG9_9CHLO|nr:Protein sel-1 1 [Tetrabaena socialis]|eukprot:PNH12313.1 Protein sel-1 1 [Tetrabaena socialis]
MRWRWGLQAAVPLLQLRLAPRRAAQQLAQRLQPLGGGAQLALVQRLRVGSGELSFSLYKQSAAQSNTHSLLCMGDAFFYGRGVAQDWVRSAALYYEAYQERSAEAMFNLGFMHEFGVGVPQDLALAKRFYHMAKHTQARGRGGRQRRGCPLQLARCIVKPVRAMRGAATGWVLEQLKYPLKNFGSLPELLDFTGLGRWNTEAALPVALAAAWLRLHGWWEALRPYLPARLAPLLGPVFRLTPPHTSLFGPWVQRAQRLLPNLALMRAEVAFWRWVEFVGLGSLGSGLRLEDAGESVALLALLGGLALVALADGEAAHEAGSASPRDPIEELYGRAVALRLAAAAAARTGAGVGGGAAERPAVAGRPGAGAEGDLGLGGAADGTPHAAGDERQGEGGEERPVAE